MHRIRTIAAAALTLLAALPAMSHAEDRKPLGVVELFTSQGCNSCPPADAFFSKLVEKGDVIALAYHVDYWDYLGWRDTMARPENTERQYAYMKALGSRAVYTPQVIVNGRSHVNGTNAAGIEDDLAEKAQQGEGMLVGIDVAEREDSIVIRVDATSQPAAEANLVLVFYDGPSSIAISRGENSGRTATFVNAVSDFRTAGMWHGKSTEFELPKSEFAEKGGCIALLQSSTEAGGPGPILGAAIIRRP